MERREGGAREKQRGGGRELSGRGEETRGGVLGRKGRRGNAPSSLGIGLEEGGWRGWDESTHF